MTDDVSNIIKEAIGDLSQIFKDFTEDEGYGKYVDTKEFVAARTEFLYDAFYNFIDGMLRAPKDPNEDTKEYFEDFVGEYWDTMMEDTIRDVLAKHFPQEE